MKTISTSIILFCSWVICSQTVQTVTPLSQSLNESSGLLHLNGKLITHNDSGGEAALYEIDTLTGNYIRKVIIQNASNSDWEDLAIDDTYIYIGDIGNNNGNRTNLKIYRVLINDYLNTLTDTISAEIINYEYADQVDFSFSQFSTNFDAEALIAFNDTLYVFTKNWGNQKTYIYPIPNILGAHSVSKTDSLDPQGLITGATYDTLNHSLVLLGNQTNPFVFALSNTIPPYFSSSNFLKTSLMVQNSIQLEGITSIGEQYYFSAEQNVFGAASLYRLSHAGSLNVSKELKNQGEVAFYPNPTSDILFVETDIGTFEVLIYDIFGRLVLKNSEKQIDCSRLNTGAYIVQFIDTEKLEFHITEKLFFIK